MQFQQAFEVEASPDAVFPELLDVPLVASCMPGAALDSGPAGVTEGRFDGRLHVTLGPILLRYGGGVSLEEVDRAARSFRMVATGSEASGGGNAGATVTRTVTAAGSGARVELGTDLQLAGRPAQFGRGIIVDMSAQLTRQSAEQLARRIGAGPSAASAGSVGGPAGSATDGPAPSLSALALVPEHIRIAGMAAGAVLVGFVLGRAGRRR